MRIRNRKALLLTFFGFNLLTDQSGQAAIWVSRSPMSVPRQHHAATLLPNGRVLVAGGDNGNSTSPYSTAELCDPSTGTWRSTGSMSVGRRDHTATLLPNGKLLVVGGGYDVNVQSFGSAELYDPATGT